LMSAILLSVAVLPGSSTTRYRCGDTTGDDVVDINDVLEILKYLAGLPSTIMVDPLALHASRVSDPTALEPTIADALEVLKLLAGLPNTIRANCANPYGCNLTECVVTAVATTTAGPMRCATCNLLQIDCICCAICGGLCVSICRHCGECGVCIANPPPPVCGICNRLMAECLCCSICNQPCLWPCRHCGLAICDRCNPGSIDPYDPVTTDPNDPINPVTTDPNDPVNPVTTDPPITIETGNPPVTPAPGTGEPERVRRPEHLSQPPAGAGAAGNAANQPIIGTCANPITDASNPHHCTNRNNVEICHNCSYCLDCEWKIYGVTRCSSCHWGGDCLAHTLTRIDWCGTHNTCRDCCGCGLSAVIAPAGMTPASCFRRGLTNCASGNAVNPACSTCRWCTDCNWIGYGILQRAGSSQCNGCIAKSGGAR
jgi:hypothetical protein